jgi:hypothetical protein
MRRTLTVAFVAIVGTLLWEAAALSQARRSASPPGTSATEVGGRFSERTGYSGGKWIELKYGRPIKRGRDLFGPPDFADALNDGAPVWRAGANVSTLLNTETPLLIGSTTVKPGEYTVFIDLATTPWTFIVSTWPAQARYDTANKAALWGAYDYTPDRDVVRVPMKVERLSHSFDQLSWQFLDVTDSGGTLAMLWDTYAALVPFQIDRR